MNDDGPIGFGSINRVIEAADYIAMAIFEYEARGLVYPVDDLWPHYQDVLYATCSILPSVQPQP